MQSEPSSNIDRSLQVHKACANFYDNNKARPQCFKHDFELSDGTKGTVENKYCAGGPYGESPYGSNLYGSNTGGYGGFAGGWAMAEQRHNAVKACVASQGIQYNPFHYN